MNMVARRDFLQLTVASLAVPFYELADRLQEQGYSASRVETILGRNFVRYARDVWGG
jgi:microsomal dipeptidase-like Zn-dependent dipeptidase